LTIDPWFRLTQDVAMDTGTTQMPNARDTDAVMVTVTEAAKLADVSVRTIRRWMRHGFLPFTEADRVKMVSPADLPEARRQAGHGHNRGHDRPGHGHGHSHHSADTDTEAVMTVAQSIAVRDTSIQPLVDHLARQEEKLTTQAEQTGWLSSERDQLRDRLEQANARLIVQATLRAPESAQAASTGNAVARDAFHPTEITLGLRVRRWLRRITEEAAR